MFRSYLLLEEGRKEGRAEGRTEGRKKGRKDGRKDGRTEERKDGRKEGRQRMNLAPYFELGADELFSEFRRVIHLLKEGKGIKQKNGREGAKFRGPRQKFAKRKDGRDKEFRGRRVKGWKEGRTERRTEGRKGGAGAFMVLVHTCFLRCVCRSMDA
jgi:hypothetical protein